MDILGIVGILLGILTIILFIVKKFNIIVAAPIATIVVLLFNDVPILETVFGKENSYMTALAGFVASNFAIFLLGSILAKYMDKAGATMVDTVKEVAELADEAVISMVRDYAQNVDVIFGENGILTAENTDGKTIIVMSTLSPDAMNELGARVEAESGLKLISAAVSGGRTGAEAGTLSIMTSGEECIVKSFTPYFDAMGSNTFYYGAAAGNSQVAKLVNNMILGINMNAVAEGLKLGDHYGLPQEEIINLLQVSTGDSWVARNWSEVSAWTAETALEVLQKDLKATYEESIKHNLDMPFNALSSIQLFHSMGKEKPKA